jgi:hypothetical protein
MALLYVNDVPQELEITPETWGDLLSSLDERAARSGVILSAARFDGVDEPAFRDPSATLRPLCEMGRVDVQTAVPAAFLRECLLETIQPLQHSADMAKRLSEIYRGHDLLEGHEGLKTLAADLGAAAVLADMLSGPIGVDLTTLTIDGVSAAEHLQQLGVTVDSLVAAQEAQDWLTVADLLEYDLEPAIRRWAGLLTLLASRLQ